MQEGRRGVLPLPEQIAEQMPGGLFIYRADEGEEILFVNDAVLKIFGCETEEQFRELTGNSFRGMVHPEDLEEVEASIKEQVERHEWNLDYVEYRIIRRDGAVRFVDDYGHLVRMEGWGELFYVFINDATEKHEALEQKRREEEERLRIEAELLKERKMREARNEFLFSISHDIRTPMNSIVGFTALAKRHQDEPELLREYLDMVDVSNRHMLSLIDDLLEMRQIGSGKTELHQEETDLSRELSEVLEVLTPQLSEKELKLKVKNDLPEEGVRVDPIRFRRILSNLVQNAVKFTPEKGWIGVRAWREEPEGEELPVYLFRVEDNGAGMSEEFMGRLFQSFEREGSATETGKSGAGLGLSIVKGLLDTMGGEVTAESKKGEGSAFTVRLPLEAVGRPAEDREDPAAGKEEDLSGKRILLVEDMEMNRMLAEKILTEAGFVVECAPDGWDAVEAVEESEEGHFDLVLMDIQMPVMNGYAAPRRIRSMAREDVKTLPILALSANAGDEDRRMSMASGMDDHIAKPFDIEQLIATIRKYLAGGKR